MRKSKHTKKMLLKMRSILTAAAGFEPATHGLTVVIKCISKTSNATSFPD